MHLGDDNQAIAEAITRAVKNHGAFGFHNVLINLFNVTIQTPALVKPDCLVAKFIPELESLVDAIQIEMDKPITPDGSGIELTEETIPYEGSREFQKSEEAARLARDVRRGKPL